MKNLPLILAATLGLTVSAGAMSAQTELVADGNGTYSYDELVAAYPDLTEETFLTVDSNADGAIDDAELAAARAAGIMSAEG